MRTWMILMLMKLFLFFTILGRRCRQIRFSESSDMATAHSKTRRKRPYKLVLKYKWFNIMLTGSKNQEFRALKLLPKITLKCHMLQDISHTVITHIFHISTRSYI
eukprot:UN25063